MQIKTVAFSLFASLAAAQSVQELLRRIPSCANPCLADASKAIGCAVNNNACQCKKSDEMTSEAIFCVSTNCEPEELGTTIDVSTQICLVVAKQAGGDAAESAGPSAIAAGTSAVSSNMDEPTSTPTNEGELQTVETPAAAVRAGAGMGLLGAAAMVALAL
ncbi:hypothetical protein DL766_005610 [Monosporascus sp. MC13-8B]|uniref:CFEM domain-containing protein n=1 Tax=Monosporascus cannonballus TaxID=155416 RepID=A0ABY0GTQ7_9PEZI|nr:hypothetical protein DL762_009307 [Monosporascus cannonballus]RYO83862.1 hypothetical protein DL763_007675 [Monosporascus cannonballus]RYP28948.1 hypothetical protein DL766_005610 [Monosporascus sp. MC13-8B]